MLIFTLHFPLQEASKPYWWASNIHPEPGIYYLISVSHWLSRWYSFWFIFGLLPFLFSGWFFLVFFLHFFFLFFPPPPFWKQPKLFAPANSVCNQRLLMNELVSAVVTPAQHSQQQQHQSKGPCELVVARLQIRYQTSGSATEECLKALCYRKPNFHLCPDNLKG